MNKTSNSNQVMVVQTRTLDGLVIRYAESTRLHDQTILLTNPWPESLYAFLPVWQKLSGYFDLVAIDLPGFGQSEARKDLYSPRAMGEFLIRVIDEFGLVSPHILGPDIGTVAALFAAANHPDKLSSLIIGGGATIYPLQVGGTLKAIIEAPDIETFRNSDATEILTASLKQGHERYKVPPEVLEDYLQSYQGSRFADSTQFVRSYPQELLRLKELLPQIQTPVQIISSLRDELVPSVNGEFLHAQLPKNNLIELDAGHYPWEDQSDQYAQIIIGWVSGEYRRLNS